MVKPSASSIGLDAGESISVLANEGILPIPGNMPVEPEPALGIGGGRDRLGASPRLNTVAPAMGRPSEPTTRPAR